ncbi:S-layer homology domain-containing protein, partial [Megasphaera elsdenii]|uniref:S-layer homology domain-containing protein n=2 Tax=Megasphaera TaxID=906 RepID=UPI001D00359E
TTTINNKVTVYNDGRIAGVAAGVANTDAVNVSQLKAVGATANMGWNLATNGVATEATNVKPGDFVDFSGDKNISVSHDGTKVKVELNKDIDVNSVQTNALNSKYNLSVGTANENGIMPFFVNSTGDFYAAHNKFHVDKDGKVTATAGEIGNVVLNNGVYTGHSALRDGELFVGDASGNYSQITPKSAKLGQVTIDEKGNIAGVNSIQTNALNAKYNLSVGTANENGIMPFFVNSNGAFYGANNNFSVDKDGKVTATAGEIGNVVLQNGVYTGHSALRDGELFVGDASGNYSQITTKGAKLGKVTVAEDGKISGVAAGAVTADSTDAVNGSQLHAVATEAGKHSKVVNGSNINVEEFDNDGQKIYKVNLNKDILLGDITGKNVSISGTNGTIETTGYIATKDRIIADKGAKLADVDITGDTISNDKSSVKLDKEGTVTINNKVTIDGNGKVSGVADGEISDTSTDAVNGSQLKKTNDRVTNVENDVKNIQGDITNIKGDITNIKGDITTIKGDVTNLDNRVTKVEQTAGKHSSVSTEDTNIQITEGTNTAGGIDYKLSLNKDQNLNSVTTGNTKMDTNGITVGDKVSLTKDGLMAGETKVTNDGLSIGGKTYVSKDGLNANNQTITNVADGKVEKGSTDAVNGGQLYETNQAIANNATNISSLSHSISNLDNRVNKVGAGAAALAALHPLDFDPDAKWDFAAGYGNYRGANAAAVGAYYRPNEDTMFSVGGSFGNGENMVNAGVSFKLGSGSSHVSTSRVAMAKEIKELRGELEAMKSAMLDANAGKKIDTSKLQLFPDVPQNHWAYEYVAQLAGNGMIEGYPDGNFAGDRPMTRYEFAAILYRAMTKGAVLSDKILSEFSHELEYFTVDTVAKDKAGNPTIQRVRTVKENINK